MSTDSQISGSNVSSRRLSSNNDSGLIPDSPVSLPLRLRSPRTDSTTEKVPNSSQAARRASIENLSDFLSKMDSSIAVNTKTSISLIKGSTIEEQNGGATQSSTSRLSEGYSTEEELSQSFRKDLK